MGVAVHDQVGAQRSPVLVQCLHGRIGAELTFGSAVHHHDGKVDVFDEGTHHGIGVVHEGGACPRHLRPQVLAVPGDDREREGDAPDVQPRG